jgi:hypothetical protein
MLEEMKRINTYSKKGLKIVTEELVRGEVENGLKLQNFSLCCFVE